MWATASEIRHGKIRTYGKGSRVNNTIIYDPQLVVSLENKAHSVTLLCSSSLVLCNSIHTVWEYRIRDESDSAWVSIYS